MQTAYYYVRITSNVYREYVMNSYVQLGLEALVPVLASVIFYILERNTGFNKIPYIWRQIIIGIVFGAIAIMGTEWGVPYEGAQINVRDAAPLCAGLLFGGPAGIIAGALGGIERWIAVAWGIGSFTRVACSVSTLIAGLYAAFLRKFLFEGKKPSVLLAFASGVVIEVFHMTMVFVTNLDQETTAANVVKVCSAPMITANSIAILLATLILILISGESIFKRTTSTRISQEIQKWLLICVALCFIVTSLFSYFVQQGIARNMVSSQLDLTLEDVTASIMEASDSNLLKSANQVKKALENDKDLNSVAETCNVSEISFVGTDGVIYESNVPEYVGFDMHTGEQSEEFLCLLTGAVKYVQPYGPISRDSSVKMKYAGITTPEGFIQVGYNSELYYKELEDLITAVTVNRRIGSTGIVMVASEFGMVISSTGSDRYKGISVKKLCEENEPLTVSEVRFASIDWLMEYTTAEGYYILTLMPFEEAYSYRDISMFTNSFMEILVFAVLFFTIYILIKRTVVNSITKVNSTLGEITQGNLNASVDVRTSEEFSSLSDDINSTVDTLKMYIAEAAARIDQELEFARNIQSSSLPSVFPAFPNHKEFDLYAHMDTAKEVGGDFYDFYFTGNNKLNLLIADVSGKGIPAALFMMRGKTLLKSLAENEHSIDEILTIGNNGLCDGNDAGMFVTAWQGQFDCSSGLIEFANAGHNPPVLGRFGQPFEFIEQKRGFVLAGMEDVMYRKQQLKLEPGDIIFLYTDGVTEATDANNELYGEQRLLDILNSRKYESMEELCRTVKEDIDAFVGEAPQFDDITMVAFKYLG